MRNPTESETQRSGFEPDASDAQTGPRTAGLETPVLQSCQGTSPSRPHLPRHHQVCYTPSDRCSQEVLDVNGILINESYFHCDEAAGYLKKPHRESFHHIKELLQEENSSRFLPRFPQSVL